MHTILGATGPIGRELARALHRDFSQNIRLVSRNPQQVNDTDTLNRADLLDADQTLKAVAGSEVVYLTAGLPMNTAAWEAQWPSMMDNVIQACATTGCKLVFFDNTYLYPQTATPQTESTSFQPFGRKGKVRAAIASQLLQAMQQGRVQALIARAPEFYGPSPTQSITNTLVIDRLKAGLKPRVFLRDDTLRTLIYTPDASRAMALLGNTPDAYGQTWHLPCDDQRLTYRQFIALAAAEWGQPLQYTVLKRWQLHLAGWFNPTLRDAAELLPRYAVDNLFVSDKFQQRFSDFAITRIADGLRFIRQQG